MRKVIKVTDVGNRPTSLLDEDFEGSDALFDYDLVHKAHIRRKHGIRLAEEGNLYDCG